MSDFCIISDKMNEWMLKYYTLLSVSYLTYEYPLKETKILDLESYDTLSTHHYPGQWRRAVAHSVFRFNCVACLSDQLITLSQGPKQLTLALRSWW